MTNGDCDCCKHRSITNAVHVHMRVSSHFVMFFLLLLIMAVAHCPMAMSGCVMIHPICMCVIMLRHVMALFSIFQVLRMCFVVLLLLLHLHRRLLSTMTCCRLSISI